jgi:hypothetical protein
VRSFVFEFEQKKTAINRVKFFLQVKASSLNVIIEPLRGNNNFLKCYFEHELALPTPSIWHIYTCLRRSCIFLYIPSRVWLVVILLLSLRWHQRESPLYGSSAAKGCEIGKYLDVRSVDACRIHDRFFPTCLCSENGELEITLFKVLKAETWLSVFV